MTDQSSDTGIFSEGGASATPESTPSPSVSGEDEVNTLLSSIRNERGEQKYDSLPKALEGLRHAQEHIPQLKTQLSTQEQELAALREALAKHEAVEDVVTRLTASQAAPATTENGLDEQKAAALFEQLLTQRETAVKVKANTEAVQNELVSKFGSAEAANKAVIAKARELGTTAEEIGLLSSQNPKMVLELFKSVQAAPNSGAPPSSNVNSEGLLSQAPQEQGLKPPEKSLLSGATYAEQKAYLAKIREEVYKKHGVTA
jgi:hypothetical protein